MSDSAALEEPRRHHYVFAHQALRQACSVDPLSFFAALGSNERDELLGRVLAVTVRHVGEPADFTPADLEVITGRIHDWPCAVIRMPVARAAAEAHLICVVLTGIPAAEEQSAAPLAFRYFTLERSFDFGDGPATVLCEWTEHQHVNFGSGPAVEVGDFVAAIKSLLLET